MKSALLAILLATTRSSAAPAPVESVATLTSVRSAAEVASVSRTIRRGLEDPVQAPAWRAALLNALQGEAKPEIARRIGLLLAWRPDEAALAAILERIESAADRPLQEALADSLTLAAGRLPAEQKAVAAQRFGPRLLKLASAPTPAAEGAVRGLGRLGAPGCPLLLELARQQAVRARHPEALLIALGETGCADAVPVLVRMTEEASSAGRRVAGLMAVSGLLRAIRQDGGALSADTERQAWSCLRRDLRLDADPELLAASIRACATASDVDEDAELAAVALESLGHASAQVRSAAATALFDSALASRPDVKELVRALADHETDATVRVLARDVLAGAEH